MALRPKLEPAAAGTLPRVPGSQRPASLVRASARHGKQVRENCFVCKNQRRERLRAHLSAALGRCIPVPAREAGPICLAALVAAPTDNHAEIRLRAAAALEGYRDLPRGRELERIAGYTLVSPAAAYSYRKRTPPVNPDKTTSYPPGGKPVKPRRSG